MRIDAMIIHHVPRGVDTPDDLDRARKILAASGFDAPRKAE
jgi:3-deoxy-manno-octulosonate cytidylyltransferase (CMP-KDO synthetase)